MIEHKKKYHHELTAHDGIGLTSNVSVRTNCQRLLARERPETHSELRRVVSEMFLVGISFLIVFGAKIGLFFLYKIRSLKMKLKGFIHSEKKEGFIEPSEEKNEYFSDYKAMK